MQQQMMQMDQMASQFPEDMIGAIKIKDGLFIGDSFAAQVSPIYWEEGTLFEIARRVLT